MAALGGQAAYRARLNAYENTVRRWHASRVAFGQEALLVPDKMSRRLVPFIDTPIQAKMEAAVAEAEAVMAADPAGQHPFRCVVLKARKGGISSWVQKFIMHRAIFYPRTEAVVICHEAESSEYLLRIATGFHENIPSDFRLKMESAARNRLEWEHKSLMLVKTAGTPESTRSYSFTVVHASERAFWPSGDRASQALSGSMAMASDTYAFVESTANGYNDFKELCDRARLPRDSREWNGYCFLFFPWFEDPTSVVTGFDATRVELDPFEEAMLGKHHLSLGQVLWYRAALQADGINGDYDKMRQENPSTPEEAFVSTGAGVFHGPSVSMLEHLAKKRPLRHAKIVDGRIVTMLGGPLSVWEEPDQGDPQDLSSGGEYVVGVDTAGGTLSPKADFSICDVWRRVSIDKMEQVAQFRSERYIPTDFAAIVDMILSLYTVHGVEPYIVPEHDAFGKTVIGELRRRFRRTRFYRREAEAQVLTLHGEDWTIGYLPTSYNKATLVETFRAAVMRCDARINSTATFDELRAFEANHEGTNVRYSAAKGKHDDCVIAAALAWLGHFQLGPVRTPKTEALRPTSADVETNAIAKAVAAKKAAAEGAGSGWVIDPTLGRIRRGVLL